MLPRVSSRVSGFPVASPCLWGKLQNLSFSKVSTHAQGCNVVLRGRRGALWHSNLFDNVSKVVLCGRRGTLDVSCCVFFANRIVRAASSGDKVQIPWQAWHFVRCDEN